MTHTKMAAKQAKFAKTTRHTLVVLVISALMIFAASCAQVAPNDPVANATSNHSQPSNPEGDEAAVRKFFDAHGAALVKADTAALDKMWADDVVLIDHDGTTLTKKQWMNLLSSGTEKIEEADPSANTTDVRIYGNTAVAIHKVTQKAILEGKPHSGKMTIGTVLVKGNQGWQMVLAQLSELKPVSEGR